MKLIYSELIEKVSYKKINCVVDFEYARKGVNEILSGLKFDDLKTCDYILINKESAKQNLRN